MLWALRHSDRRRHSEPVMKSFVNIHTGVSGSLLTISSEAVGVRPTGIQKSKSQKAEGH